MSSNKRHTAESSSHADCFIIMPISDPDHYPADHFKHVYEDLFMPACEIAGLRPVRADDVKQTNLIHLDVLQKLIESPMALCDLSTRNPNVLFELGLRQAFDKAVVLVRECGTPDIFDIAPLRYTEYRKSMVYHEVRDDQRKIADAIIATQEAFNTGQGINSIIRLLSLTRPASLFEVQEADKDPLLQIIRAEISELRSDFRAALSAKDTRPSDNANLAQFKPEYANRLDRNGFDIADFLADTNRRILKLQQKDQISEHDTLFIRTTLAGLELAISNIISADAPLLKDIQQAREALAKLDTGHKMNSSEPIEREFITESLGHLLDEASQD